MHTKKKNNNRKQNKIKKQNKTTKITLRISKDQSSNGGKSKIPLRYIKQILRILRI